MRINKFIARATGLSRRGADAAISQGKVVINHRTANLGDNVTHGDEITLDGQTLSADNERRLVMLNKPVGYVCSRNGQGSPTIYELLPPDCRDLKPIGRLDKDSSGLLVLTNDGDLADHLAHPRYAKTKIYELKLSKPLNPAHRVKIEQGVRIEDYISRLKLSPDDKAGKNWQASLSQGRNRQIRRTFAALGYNVETLHRIQFGPYALEGLPPGHNRQLTSKKLDI